MKKIYLTPEMEIVEIKANQQLLAGSTIPMGDPGSANDAEAPGYNEDLAW